MIQYLVTNNNNNNILNNNSSLNSESTTPPINFCIVGGSTLLKFPIYYEGDILNEKTFGIALGPMSGSLDRIKLPDDLQVLVFLDGFNQDIPEGFIGSRVTTLHFCDIGKSIKVPPTVKNVYFEDGFNKEITSDLLPESVKEIHLFNIKSKLTQDSFSQLKQLNFIYLENGFSLSLEPGVLPVSSTIRINNISQPLVKGSIAQGTQYVVFQNYNHEIINGVVPESTIQLIFNNIGKPLIQGSIPSSASIEVIFDENYSQPLNENVIPDTITELEFRCFDFPPLLVNSLHSNIKTIYCCKQLRKDERYFKNIENFKDKIKKKSIF